MITGGGWDYVILSAPLTESKKPKRKTGYEFLKKGHEYSDFFFVLFSGDWVSIKGAQSVWNAKTRN